MKSALQRLLLLGQELPLLFSGHTQILAETLLPVATCGGREVVAGGNLKLVRL